MIELDDFAEMVERSCVGGWRSAIGRDRKEVINRVNSVLISHEEVGGRWRFILSLRLGKVWHQSERTIDPPEYDLLNPAPPDEVEQNPREVASQIVSEMLTEVVGKMVF